MNFELNLNEVNLVLEGLRELPMKRSADLHAKIFTEATKQANPAADDKLVEPKKK